jgi:hypothetical protein
LILLVVLNIPSKGSRVEGWLRTFAKGAMKREVAFVVAASVAEVEALR